MGRIMVDLQESRNKIDEIDKQIVHLFEERMKVAKDVAEYKIHKGKAVFDKEREEQKIQMLTELASNDFNRQGIEELFTQIMSISRKLQYSLLLENESELSFQSVGQLHMTPTTKVAFFGETGSYTEQAMQEFFGEKLQSISCKSFEQVMKKLESNEAQYGVLPIENSSTGGITDIYDLLMQYNNVIIGEHIIRVEHALLGVKGSKIEELETVYSHSQALRQCRPFFSQYDHIELKEYESTSAAAKKVAEEGNKKYGAVASVRASEEYGLEVLEQGINYENRNSTRFIIISNRQEYLENANKVIVCFELPHESGTLYTMLSHFIFNHLNMTKIESRPIRGKTWEYRFFVEFEGNLKDSGVKNAIRGILSEASKMRVLGNFKSL